jgi:HAE1 family hydrophobic/amphiphilic exporter-1
LALGIGEGAETQAPMATVVIGGLLLSTLLTLVFIPVLYTIFDDFNDFLKKKFFKNKSVRV